MIGEQTRRTAKAGLHAAGWYDLQISRTVFPGVLVLCYHGLRTAAWRDDEPAFPDLHVSAETFAGHCEVLRRTCHPISIGEWRDALKHRSTLPERSVIVTFDDGYRSVFDVARPILKAHDVPAAVFVCTQPVENGELFWFDEAARAAPDVTHENDPLAPMRPEHVRIMAGEGFEIGVHTVSHPVLAEQSAEAQRHELARCQQTLEGWTGRRPTALAYPFGRPDVDYSSTTVEIARELGFDFAFTTRPDFSRPGESPLERSRFLVLAEVSAPELAHRIAHSWHQ